MKTLLKNGKIIDGTGAEAYLGDVLIEGDKILKIGENLTDTADKILDCTNLCIAPGFIDAHSHNDWFAARQENNKFFSPFLEQGITTQVTGNCGFSPFGFDRDTEHRELLGSRLFTIGDVEGETATLPEFEKAIKNLPVNMLPLYGHMSGRIGISGYDSRELTEAELAHLDEITEQTLNDGAAGISFGLMYEPDRYAPYEELKRAAKICAKHDKILTVHGRACSAASTSYSPPFGGRAHNLRALDEMVQLARDTGVKLQHSHLIFVGEKSWKTVDEALSTFEKLSAEGLPVMYDSYSMLYGASVITVVLPTWYLSLSNKKRGSVFTKLRLAVEIGVTKKILGFSFSDITIAWLKDGEEKLVGKTVTQIAKDWGVSELSAYIKLVDMSEGKGRVLMHKYLTNEILLKLMKDKNCLCMTDAWVEEQGKQNPSCYICMPQFLKLARENGISTVHMINRMTGAVAERFSIKDRGVLRENYFADITIFDENKVAPGQSDEGRPVGIEYVLVNGEIAVEKSAFSNGNAGRLLLQK